ncbi:hypothetical protein QZH41_010608 [Actinostola sp. cb2023]|nr:hypothetical protein QZH41_010608 [Actinostola sp. cb2023]
MPTTLSRPDFSELDNQPRLIQKKLFKKYQDQFKTEEVKASEKNVQPGNHLANIRPSKKKTGKWKSGSNLYTHHRICIDVNDDKVMVVEYTGPHSTSSDISRIVSSDVGLLGIVKISEYTFTELEDQKVQKIIWPECLIRYDDNEIVERAKSRIGETFYGALENNYEQLVSWCICGINVSLQVNWWHIFIRDALYTILAGSKSLVVDGIILKIAANVSGEVMGSVFAGASWPTMIIGFAVGAVLETGFAAYQIHKAYTQWKEKSISGEQFKVRLVEIIIKGVFRFGFGVIGSIIGLKFYGRLGSFVVGALGAIRGHITGFTLSAGYENRKVIRLKLVEAKSAFVKKITNVQRRVQRIQRVVQRVVQRRGIALTCLNAFRQVMNRSPSISYARLSGHLE